MRKIVLLGSGELGKELVIALKRLGEYVIACDSYANAPAMQVADECEVLDMLNMQELDKVVMKHKPDIIVPEIEAIRTEQLYQYEQDKIQVVPSAKAVNYTMNRKAIRELAAVELGLQTAKYAYAENFEQLQLAVETIGLPCVVKPLMSSSGKGQSIIKEKSDIKKAWEYGIAGSRGDLKELIIEEFIDFDYEITLLTLTQKTGETLFCPPIGHVQVRGDYQESFQPMPMGKTDLLQAEAMAERVTKALGGEGIWGVEFFVSEKNGVYFSEISPRPHDTGMVTLAGTQNLNEFELHARAILGYPVQSIDLFRSGVSHVILSTIESNNQPHYLGIEKALSYPKSEVRIFGKPTTRINRRMGVVTVYGEVEENLDQLRVLAANAANCIKVE